MTFRNSKLIDVRPFGVEIYLSRDSSVNEYRCRLVEGGVPQPEADYFTQDKGDAKATAGLMANRAYANGVKTRAASIPLDELAELRRIVTQVWQQIGHDVLQCDAECGGGELDNEAAVESCLDADRPLMVGAAERVLTKLAFEKYGFDAVRLAVSKTLNLV